jgi:hypothetical protein
MTPFDKEYRLCGNYLAGYMRKWNPLEVAVDTCRKEKLNIFTWITLFDSYLTGLEDSFFAANPELLMRSRDGNNAMRGVPCYACPRTQKYRLQEAMEVSEYGVDGIFYSIHSHTCCVRQCDDPEGTNIFGYNPEVVTAYKSKYGIDILKEDFDPYTLYELQGEFLTDYLRKVRTYLKKKNQQLYCTFRWENEDGVHGSGRTMTYIGYPKGRAAIPFDNMVGIHLDCQKWIREGIVDGVSAQADFVDEILKVKERAGGGNFYLWIYCGFDPETTKKRLPAIERAASEALNSGLSGCIFHEECSFDGLPDLWKVIRNNVVSDA